MHRSRAFRREPSVGRQGSLLLGLLLLASFPARAADDARTRLLEARVLYLERKLESLETRLDHRYRTVSNPSAVSAARLPPTASMKPPAPLAAPKVSQSQQDMQAAPAAPPPKPSLGVGNPADAPQEAFVFRQNAVTLSPLRVEADLDFGYVRSNGFLQTDRAAIANASVRVGVLDWLEVNATIPAFATSRSRSVGPFRTQTRQVSGVGDVLVQANARIHEQTADTPGVVLSLGALLPTGPNPYDFRNYQPDPKVAGYNPNPTNLNAAFVSRGAWGIVTHLEFYKTIDPVIVFFGAGANYLFPQTVAGRNIQAGVIYDYNMGLSLALSDKSTLGVQVEGAYQAGLTVNRRLVPQSDLEPVVVRVSAIQRIFEDTWVEPSFAAGLTSNAPGLALDVGLRHRF